MLRDKFKLTLTETGQIFDTENTLYIKYPNNKLYVSEFSLNTPIKVDSGASESKLEIKYTYGEIGGTFLNAMRNPKLIAASRGELLFNPAKGTSAGEIISKINSLTKITMGVGQKLAQKAGLNLASVDASTFHLPYLLKTVDSGSVNNIQTLYIYLRYYATSEEDITVFNLFKFFRNSFGVHIGNVAGHIPYVVFTPLSSKYKYETLKPTYEKFIPVEMTITLLDYNYVADFLRVIPMVPFMYKGIEIQMKFVSELPYLGNSKFPMVPSVLSKV